MSERYYVRPKEIVTQATRPVARNRRVTVYVVMDRTTNRVARGTKGEGGSPTGYESKTKAERVARDMNKVQKDLDAEKARREQRKRR